MFVFTHFEQMIKKGVVTTILNKRVVIFFRCCETFIHDVKVDEMYAAQSKSSLSASSC